MAKKKKSKKKKSKEKAVDRFNRRLGTQGALIDTALGAKGKSVAAIAKEVKLSVGRVSTHLRDLTGKGFLKKDKDGKYSVKEGR